MNLDTVLLCAQMAASQQQNVLGYVSAQVQALIDATVVVVAMVIKALDS